MLYLGRFGVPHRYPPRASHIGLVPRKTQPPILQLLILLLDFLLLLGEETVRVGGGVGVNRQEVKELGHQELKGKVVGHSCGGHTLKYWCQLLL